MAWRGSEDPMSHLRCLTSALEAASGFLEQFAKSESCFITINRARCHVEHQSLPLLAVRFRLDSVEPQEHDRSHHGSPFVSIDKGVILADVEQIGSGDFYNIGIGRFASEAGLWRQHCRGK